MKSKKIFTDYINVFNYANDALIYVIIKVMNLKLNLLFKYRPFITFFLIWYSVEYISSFPSYLFSVSILEELKYIFYA